MSTEVIPAGEQPVVQVDTSPAAMLAIAVQQGTPIAELQAMMDLQERWEANQAKKAFVKAMAKFKKNAPRLDRNANVFFKGKNGKPDTNFDFTSLDRIIELLDPALAKCGLSFNWTTSQDLQGGGMITVTCTLTHINGHSESTSLSGSPDQSGGKNNIQAVGSTTSYLQRYTLRAITGTAEAGSDNDGAGGAGEEIELITDEQALKIESLISDHDLDSAAFHAWMKQAMGIEHVDEIPADRFRAVVRKINATIAAKEEREPGQDG